jgi:hypothetical protein
MTNRETSMQALRFFLSPSGWLKPQPFIYGAIAVYLFGAASHLLTTADILRRSGLLPFIAGLAVGIALLYLLSVVLLLIVADGFFTTSSSAPMGDASAQGALWLLLLLYVVSALAGSGQYDLTWVVVAILIVMAFVPILVALCFSVWVARKPSAKDA